MKLQEFKLDLFKRGFNIFETWNVNEQCVEVLLFKFDTDQLRFESKFIFPEDVYEVNKAIIEYLKAGSAKIEVLMSRRHVQSPDTCKHSVKALDDVNNVCEFCMGKIGSTMPLNLNSN